MWRKEQIAKMKINSYLGYTLCENENDKNTHLKTHVIKANALMGKV